MFLFELYDDDSNDDDSGGVIHQLRDDIVDLLIPLAAHGVPFVSVDKIMDKMRDKRTGFEVSRDLVFQVLDPDKVAIINRIEGDKVYFSMPKDEDRAVKKDQKEKDQNTVANKAVDQAKQNLKQ